MNEQQRNEASSILKLLEVPSPYTDAECQLIIDAHQAWYLQNPNLDVHHVKIRVLQSSLGYFAAMEKAANEVKIRRG